MKWRFKTFKRFKSLKLSLSRRLIRPPADPPSSPDRSGRLSPASRLCRNCHFEPEARNLFLHTWLKCKISRSARDDNYGLFVHCDTSRRGGGQRRGFTYFDPSKSARRAFCKASLNASLAWR
jgi:hypothetical protein